MLKLYDYPDCPYAQKVRVVLAEKELEYETVLVDLRKQEQRTPEFLRLNPLGKVPILVDDDEVVCDSTIINEYLEDEYPSTRLMPEDSQGRAQVRWFEDYCDNEFIPYTIDHIHQRNSTSSNAASAHDLTFARSNCRKIDSYASTHTRNDKSIRDCLSPTFP